MKKINELNSKSCYKRKFDLRFKFTTLLLMMALFNMNASSINREKIITEKAYSKIETLSVSDFLKKTQQDKIKIVGVVTDEADQQGKLILLFLTPLINTDYPNLL